MIENPPNTRPAWKRYRDLVPGDFVVGRGKVTHIAANLFVGGQQVFEVTTANGERSKWYGGVETLVRVPTGTPVTESLAVEVAR